MIGAGFIADMNKKFQQNRGLLRKNGFFNRGNHKFDSHNKATKIETPVDPKLLEQIAQKACRENNNGLALTLLKIIGTIVALLLLSYILINIVFKAY